MFREMRRKRQLLSEEETSAILYREEEREKREAIEKLAVKYAPEDTAAGREDTIDRYWETFCTLEMRIDHMTGKEGMELVRERQKD